MSNRTVNINVHHVTRLEGHGNIVLNATNGTIEKLQWQVPEAPRFFEAMVRGRSYEDIQTIVSRICGICSITHSLASTKAVENAMGIQVSEQTDKIRVLMHYSEQLQSHVLHVGYLAAPDFFGVPSVVPLVAMAPDAVKTIIGLHRLANEWSDLLAGRTTHPVTLRPGGLTKIPTEKQLRELQDRLKKSLPSLKVVADVVLSVAQNVPKFERPTEYISLKQTNPPAYTFYHGDITSTDYDGAVAVNDWKTVANEYVSDQSTAKWTRWHRGAGPVQQQRRAAVADRPGGGQDVRAPEGLLQSVPEYRGATGRSGACGGKEHRTDRCASDQGAQARGGLRRPEGRQGQRLRRSPARHPVPRVRVRPQGPLHGGGYLHSDEPEPRQHPEGFREAGAGDIG
jgi:coenzyme F420-reducing hydrogenase alpha subunit